MSNATKPRAAIYARISDDREGTGLQTERQIKDCRELADRLGVEVVKVWNDESKSAFSGKRRPEYEKMLQGIRDGLYDVVLAWGNDRLTRRPRELEDLADLLIATEVKVHTVTSGEYDLSTATGLTNARVVGAVAAGESMKTSERLQGQKRHAKAAGKVVGGQRPFGWVGKPLRSAFVKEEIVVLREMAARVLAGESVSGITNDLNARGILTATGKPWSRTSVRWVLTNPASAGLVKQPDGGVVEATWEGAWDRDTWNRLCAILKDPSRKTTHRLRSYLLTGLLVDRSGRKLITGHDHRGRKYRSDTTVPGMTGGVGIPADLVEQVVVDAVLDASDEIRKLDEPEVEAPFAEVDALQDQLDMLVEKWAEGEISTPAWNASRLKLEARLKDAKRSVKLPSSAVTDWGTPGQLRSHWDELSLAQKRDAIEGFVERVVIWPGQGKGRKVGAARVDIRWKLPLS